MLSAIQTSVLKYQNQTLSVAHHGKQLVKSANTIFPVRKKKKPPLRLSFMSSVPLWQYGTPARVERGGKTGAAQRSWRRVWTPSSA